MSFASQSIANTLEGVTFDMAIQVVSATSEQAEDSAEPPDPPSPSLILLIYSVIESLQRGETSDLVTDLETLTTAYSVARALRAGGHRLKIAPIRCEDDLLAAVADLDPQTTFIFNLCEALHGTIDGESHVPRVLDELGFHYGGGSPLNLDTCRDKAYTKALLLAQGIPTAPYQVFRAPDERIEVPLPAIIKPVAEDCSVGITCEAVATNPEALRQRVAYILKTYKQPALAEMFLDGREFNVSLWGNGGSAHVLGIGESVYPPCAQTLPIMNFNAKWDPTSPEYHHFRTRCPARLDPQLEDTIRTVALRAYLTTGCRDYARVDLREKDGQIYVLEVNPNPCLAADGGFAKAARAAGYSYASMIHQIVYWAWRRTRNTL